MDRNLGFQLVEKLTAHPAAPRRVGAVDPMAKLANNPVLGCAMIAMAEGFSLVRKYG